jgi:hypothetical protein
MPKNLDKMVEARRAKTGESYQAALRHVRGSAGRPGGRLEGIIRKLIVMARERNSEESGPAYNTRQLVRRIKLRYKNGREPKAQLLLDSLKALSPEDIRKVELVMYSGRENEHVYDMHRALGEEDPDVAVSIVFGKSPLDEYLREGLERARRDGLDLDAPLPPRFPLDGY